MAESAKAPDSGAAPAADSTALLASLWHGRHRMVVFDDRFDGGLRFLACWQAWQRDPHRCAHLHVITASSAHALQAPHPLLREAMPEEWPAITPNLHRLAFDGGRVQWLLAPYATAAALRELVAHIDLFMLEGEASEPPQPALADPQASRQYAKALARLAAPDAQLMLGNRTLAHNPRLRPALISAGFVADSPPADGTRWRHAPTYIAKRGPARIAAPGSVAAPGSQAPVLIVGAGLAGCAMAWALAEQGVDSLLIERRAAPAVEGSGNPAGIFHGAVHAQDGAHARFNRAAALEAQRAVATAIDRHGAAGGITGLLRLDDGEHPLPAEVDGRRALLAALGLPSNHVQALTAVEASTLSGLPLHRDAWWYPGGGWAHPAGLARAFLARAGTRCRLLTHCSVAALATGPAGWQLLDADGAVLATSPIAVLANAGDAQRLLRPWLGDADPDAWPVSRIRGQISWTPADGVAGFALPHVPLAGSGYLLPVVDGQAIFGATSQRDDEDASVRESDHRINLARLIRLLGFGPNIDVSRLQGRTQWRWSADDRLPLLGAVPDLAAARALPRLEQPAQVPRLQGLYACTAFGSRGITWAALAAQTVAAVICGTPLPIEASLFDAVDAARFVSRRSRRPR